MKRRPVSLVVQRVYRSCQRWLLGSLTRRLGSLCLVISLLVWMCARSGHGQTGNHAPWKHRPADRATPTTKYFTQGRHDHIFLYSAIANSQLPSGGDIHVIMTVLDGSTSPLTCCVLLDNSTLFTVPAREYFFYHVIDVAFVARIVEYFQPNILKARQYSCLVPDLGHVATHATLTSNKCSSDLRDYLPIYFPPRVPGGLAICAKIAHSNGLDPEKVIEWFELQRTLGVDKVLMFDLGNGEKLQRVFSYYQRLGVLDLMPYELPGGSSNRTLLEKDKRSEQFHHDESMAVIECRQRMAGYSLVLSHDLDEFVIPRRDIGLKQFFKEKLEEYRDSAGFVFDTEFFIYNWGPSNPEQDLALTRYQKATLPHWECNKFVFLPHRTLSIKTHDIYPLSPYTTYKLPSQEVILHHYRRCPDDVWPTCFPATLRDPVMTRYTHLHERVLKVRQETDTWPTWSLDRRKA